MKSLKDIIGGLQKADKFKTTNDQPFYSAPYQRPLNFEDYQQFKVGTMYGLWKWESDKFVILAFLNNNPGNGHLEDTLDWFMCSSVCAQVPLVIRSVDNTRFLKHLIDKRGFVLLNDGPDVIKSLKQIESEVKIKLDRKIYFK